MVWRRFSLLCDIFPDAPLFIPVKNFKDVILSPNIHGLWHLLTPSSSVFSKSWGAKSEAGNKYVFPRVDPY